jgi:hypothetical protein
MTNDTIDEIENCRNLHAEYGQDFDLKAFCHLAYQHMPEIIERLRTAERKAAAFDAIASGQVEVNRELRNGPWRASPDGDFMWRANKYDLLDAVEAVASK